jgi:hypothetical protein
MSELEGGQDFAMTPIAWMRARGASEHEIKEYQKRQEKKMRLSMKK